MRTLDTHQVDGENTPILLHECYGLDKDSFRDQLEAVFEKHPEVFVVPMSGLSAGGGVFQSMSKREGIIGIQLPAIADPEVRYTSRIELSALHLNEIQIDTRNRRVGAGAGVTLGQLNNAIRDYVGQHYRVLGADLTSYTYAQVGSTFMTGGMGPQRRYFSDSVESIELFDGSDFRQIEASDLIGLAGTYGWTGLVTAICCRYVETPANEIAFAIPVNSSPEILAGLLASLGRFCYPTEVSGVITNKESSDTVLLGLEHITLESMGPMLKGELDGSIRRRAESLVDKCQRANADSLVFVNGFTDGTLSDAISELADDSPADEISIAGISLDHSEVFADAEEMRSLRESVPYAARNRLPTGAFVYKNHTDATIRISPDDIQNQAEDIWRINCKYVDSVSNYFSENSQIRGDLLVYGHLNPYGIDPHNRVTMACDSEQEYTHSVAKLECFREQYYIDLAHFCASCSAQFIGGEKGAASEAEMLTAWGNSVPTPEQVAVKLTAQRREISRAKPAFSWRAFEPYTV
ncbi:MAG: FAD-binding protein [Pseudomonadota bacterium]